MEAFFPLFEPSIPFKVTTFCIPGRTPSEMLTVNALEHLSTLQMTPVTKILAGVSSTEGCGCSNCSTAMS